VTRFIGRLDSDSSPVKTVSKSCPANKPHNSRIDVPEFPEKSQLVRGFQTMFANTINLNNTITLLFNYDTHVSKRLQRSKRIFGF
jgi:hypothetical protein